MHQIISFFVRYKYFLLFLVLELIAFTFTIQSHSFHRSRFVNSSNIVTGFVYDKFNLVTSHRKTKEYNLQLSKENRRLKNLLVYKRDTTNSLKINVLDSLVYQQKFTYINAIIKNNAYVNSTNFLTINKGEKDSVFKNQGVINSKGIIGIVANTSNHYATVMSILNENSKINARLKKNPHYGTITWNADNYKTVQFEDLPRQANLKVGDTIITDGKSTIFPEGILIGTIKDFEIKNNNYKNVNVTLFNDMSAIKHINIVTNLDKLEIKALENNNE